MAGILNLSNGSVVAVWTQFSWRENIWNQSFDEVTLAEIYMILVECSFLKWLHSSAFQKDYFSLFQVQ